MWIFILIFVCHQKKKAVSLGEIRLVFLKKDGTIS